jgi:two-component system, OmpR family, copper resistance phosphate regulon response regulator CusR
LRVLLVEDEVKVANALKQGLEAEHYEVRVAHTGEEAFFLATTQPFDLLLLDLMLPGRSGLEILAALRQRGLQTRVLILTAKDSVEDRVVGLDGGADDYLVKPFAFPELLARIRALVRRAQTDATSKRKVADLELDGASHKVTRQGQPIELTRKEFDLLEYLMQHAGQTVSREMLARDVWQVNERATPLDNVIDVHIARLRKKIDEPFEVALVRTIRGVGFLLGEGGL